MLYILVPLAVLGLIALFGWWQRPKDMPEPQHGSRTIEEAGPLPGVEQRLRGAQAAQEQRLFDWEYHVPPRDLDPNVDFWLQDLSRRRRDRWT